MEMIESLRRRILEVDVASGPVCQALRQKACFKFMKGGSHGVARKKKVMKRIVSGLLCLVGGISVFAQSPHGEGMRIDCGACHRPEGWDIPRERWVSEQGEGLEEALAAFEQDGRFRHSQTGYTLEGRHAVIDCKDCHATLKFEEASPACVSCHTDLHQMTVGDECARCHSTDHWLVEDIMGLHVQNGFPLLGQHAVADCRDCHRSETVLRFDRVGNDCVNCHLEDYQSTESPDHAAAGYSLECLDCHDMSAAGWQWTTGAANHLFFPLTGGHAINDCNRCHANGNFQDTPSECVACHLADFQSADSPDHTANNFPTDCAACHTTGPGWEAGSFSQHDQLYFPIFSGKHAGEWNQCVECHTTPGNFKQFSCIDCHEHNNAADLADEHDEVSGYMFSSQACYACHPKGRE
jgi:Zn finger protein HypA/HybF involved in hydrogenase expression